MAPAVMFAGTRAERLFRDNQRVAAIVASRFAGRGCSALGLEWDDLHQIALVALWNAADTHDPEHPQSMPFSCYVRAKATQAIIDAIRTHKAILCYEDGDLVADDAPSTVAEADARDLRERLQRAIRRLPARWRLLIEWRLQGRSLRDVGAALGVTESRACQIEAAAIELLRNRMRRGSCG